MMKQQGFSWTWLLETGKICIDKTTMLTTMLTYACFNLLTSYYNNDHQQ